MLIVQADVVIIGAGPAGAAAASLLAQHGHSVVLVHKEGGAASSLAESLPPSSSKVLDALGAREAVDTAGFVRASGNTVVWESGELRREQFAAGMGYQVDRARFDGTLRESARRAGATVVTAAVRDDVVEGPDEVRVTLDDEVVRARYVMDASGRAGVVARRRWRRPIPSPRTVALVARWGGEWNDEHPTHTFVESYADGWAWSVPLADGTRCVSVMVDPQRTHLAKGAPALEVYRAELGKTRELARLTAAMTLTSGPRGCDASVYDAERYAEGRLLLVGDAGSFIDPLSSFGVKKALASGWLAAVAVHTALVDEVRAAPALRFFDDRERHAAAALMTRTREMFSGAADRHAHRFWADRAQDDGFDRPGALDPLALRADPRVQRAFETLKALDTLALERASGLDRLTPVVRGHEIVLEPALLSPECPQPIRYLRDVDVVALAGLAPHHTQVPHLFEAYNQHQPPVALPDFLGALATLVAFGFLRVR